MATLERNTEVLCGPHGTVKELRGVELGVPDLHIPINILNGGVYVEETEAVVKAYAPVIDIATTDTFRLRNELRVGDEQTFRLALVAHFQAVLRVVGSLRQKIYVSCGPYAINCYDVDQAPGSVNEARDFHAQQLSVIRQLRGVDRVLFETVSTSREAVGQALAAKEAGLEAIVSFVIEADGKLKSGEGLAEAISRVDDASGRSLDGFAVNCCPVEGVWAAIDESNGQRGRIIGAYPNACGEDVGELDESMGVIGLEDSHVSADELVRIALAHNNLRFASGCCGFEPEDIAVFARAIAGVGLGVDRVLGARRVSASRI